MLKDKEMKLGPHSFVTVNEAVRTMSFQGNSVCMKVQVYIKILLDDAGMSYNYKTRMTAQNTN